MPKFNERLKQLRQEADLSQAEFAKQIGTSKSSVNMYERGEREPGIDTLEAIADYFNVDMDYLLGKSDHRNKLAWLEELDRTAEKDPCTDVPSKTKKAPSLSDEAMKIAHDYNELDHYGKNLVKIVVTEENKRVREELSNRKTKPIRLYDEVIEDYTETRVIPLYRSPAAAGLTSPVFGEDFEYIEVSGDVPPAADFAVKISGDSMEPYIMDGATAYINRDPLSDGDIGIFFVDGDMLCKQYHKAEDGTVYLLSLNRVRADADRIIPPDSGINMTCFGRVMMEHRVKPVF